MTIKRLLAVMLISMSFMTSFAVATTNAADDGLDGFLSSLDEIGDDDTTTTDSSDEGVDLDSLTADDDSSNDSGIEYEPEGEEYTSTTDNSNTDYTTNNNDTTQDISAPVNLDALSNNNNETVVASDNSNNEQPVARQLSSTGTSEALMFLLAIMLISGIGYIRSRK